MNKYRYNYGRKPAKQIPSDPMNICKGGSYMHQSGPTHDFCKNIFNTPEGKIYYKQNSCRKRGILMGAPLDYSIIISPPLSDANWNNAIKCRKY